MVPQLFRNSDVGLAVFDHHFRYQVVNPYLAASNGASIEAHLGKHVREILGEVGAQVETALHHVFATGHSVLNYEVAGTFKTKPKGGHWLDTLFPITSSDGNVRQVGILVVELGPKVEINRPPVLAAPGAVLRSWKEIAGYVGSCVKTVQRWEHEHNFPVRRISENKGSVVFAFKEDIDTWLRNRTPAAKPSATLEASDRTHTSNITP